MHWVISMSKKMDINDFRAIRWALEPSDFAISDGIDHPPTDLIDEKVWQAIMNLPDDVAISTTSHQGDKIAYLYELWCSWIRMMPPEEILRGGMLDANNDLSASIFNLMHGFYKQAIASLRSFAELMLYSSYCFATTDTEMWSSWNNGDEFKFGVIAKKFAQLPDVRMLDEEAFALTEASIFPKRGQRRDSSSWAADLYRRLCKFAHADGRNTNANLWNSNGPVYSADGMMVSYLSYLETYALICVIMKLINPQLALDDTVNILFEQSSILQYTQKPFSDLCWHYVNKLLK